MTNVHPTAVVHEGAELGADVEIGPYAVIGPHVRIGDGVRIMAHATIDGRTSLGANCTVFPFACLGTQTQDLKYRGAKSFVRIGERTTVREYVTINSGTQEDEVTGVGDGCLLMAYVHVAHGCTVGNGVILANGVQLAGHVVVEDMAVAGGLTGIHQFVRVGKLSILGGGSLLRQDAPPFMMVVGNPARVPGLNAVGLKRRGFSPEVRRLLKQAYRILYRENLSTRQALERIRAQLPLCPEVEYLTSFVSESSRGIVK